MYDRMMERGQTLHRLKLSGYQSMKGIQSRKDLRVLSDAKFQWLTTKTVEARVIQMKWWCCLFMVLSRYQDADGKLRPMSVSNLSLISRRAA